MAATENCYEVGWSPRQLVDIKALETHAVHRFVDVDPHCSIHYWIYGTGPEHVIFLEGLDSTHYGWEEQIRFFASITNKEGQPRFSVAAIDNRGSGRSTILTANTQSTTTSSTATSTSAESNPYVWSIATMAHDTSLMLQDCGWWEQGGIHAVGLSMGGMIVQELWLIDPSRFASVSLVSTSGGDLHWWNVLPMSAIWGLLGMELLCWSRESKRRQLISLMYSPSYTSSNEDYLWRKMTRREELSGDSVPAASKAQTDAIFKHYTLKRLGEARALQQRSGNGTRFIVMCGTGDKMLSPSCSQQLARYIGCKLLQFDGAGHQLNDECIDQVNKVLLDHFTGNSTGIVPTSYPLNIPKPGTRYGLCGAQDDLDCYGAMSIPSLPFVYSASTLDQPESYIDCFRLTSRGFLFSYLSNTPTTLEADTCNTTSGFDTQIFVFSGCHTDGVVDDCIVDDDDSCNLTSRVKWVAESSTLYYIFVSGFGATTGTFMLNVRVSTSNDSEPVISCESASVIEELPFTAIGSTTASSELSACSVHSPAKLYSYVPSVSGKVTASTCNNITNFDTEITVFANCAMDGIGTRCITNNDDADSCGIASQVEWQANASISYTIAIGGYDGDSGDFYLLVQGNTEGSEPSSDRSSSSSSSSDSSSFYGDSSASSSSENICDNAVEISALPFEFEGVINEDDISYISCTGKSYPGTLFSVTTNTRVSIEASTCDSSTTLDTILVVFTGCNRSTVGAQCINENDDACGDQSFVTWEALPHVEYFIFVGSSNHNEGTFFLSVIEAGVESKQDQSYSSWESEGSEPAILNCSRAITIKTLPFTYSGNTLTEPTQTLSCLPVSMKSSLFVYIPPSKVDLEADTCDNTAIDTTLAVFTGCRSDGVATDCVGTSEDSCDLGSYVEWSATKFTSYYILVGSSSEAGNFTLHVKESHGIGSVIVIAIIGCTVAVLLVAAAVTVYIISRKCPHLLKKKPTADHIYDEVPLTPSSSTSTPPPGYSDPWSTSTKS
ncbi:Alpha/Beta hydrolase protein [Pelomyxa schiedti]|nr:Alpha/Beta hydrolase protein [Pelomyxa schiedti]